MPAQLRSMREGCYVKSSRTDPELYATSFVIVSDDIRLNVYEELQELRGNKHNAASGKAMLYYRGVGVPRHANRVEFQVRKGWRYALGMDTADAVRDRLDTVLESITSEGPYPFFRLIKKPPDVKSGN